MKLKELPNTVVHCETRDEYDQLMRIYEDAGWRWNDGQRPTEWSPWEYGAKLPCSFNVNDRFYCNSAGSPHRKLSLSEFLEEQGILCLADLKLGDWVEVIAEIDSFFLPGTKLKIVEDEGTDYVGNMRFRVQNAEGIDDWIYNGDLPGLRRCDPPEKEATPMADSYFLKSHCTVTFPNNPIIPFTPSFMDCCRSIVSKARDLALSPMEKKYRTLGLKDENGLTNEGKAVLLDLLFQKFGKELMDPVVKKLAAQDSDENDE